MLRRRTTGFRRQMQRDDGGFSLIEVVVAMVVLLVFAGALSVTLLDGLSVSKVSRERVGASNLAARELEIVRNSFSSSDASALAVGATSSVTNANPLSGAVGTDSVVDGVPYTVRRDVQWLPTGTGTSACDGGALVISPALQVFVSVTWPNMRTARAVTAETVMTPLKGTTDDLTVSYIAVKVQNADGTAAEAVTATATGPGGSFVHTTDGSGCAVFQVGTAGTYSVTLNQAGWVDQSGTRLSIKTPVVATIGTLVTKTMTYDLQASMNVTLGTPGGYVLPSPLPAINYVKLNALGTLVQQTVPATAGSTAISSLWPWSTGYAAWPGGCPDSDPATAPTTGGSRGGNVIIAPGGSKNVTANLAPVNLTVQTSAVTGGKPVPGVTITATNSTRNPIITGPLTCTSADRVLTLGTTDGAGNLKTSLPYGNWNLDTKWNGNTASPGLGAATATAITDPMTPAGTGVNAELFVVN